MRLCQSGEVTNDNKGLYDGYSVTTFAAGVPELYDWLDGNRDVRFLPVSVINSPEIMSRNRNMTTINGATAIDVMITEYGAAELQGLTVRERARALATIGHAGFLEELTEMAEVWPG
jgi:acyl-CoA hydrolase